jgi:hypothetical protein
MQHQARPEVRRRLTPPAGGSSRGGGSLAYLVYAAGFLVFDREAGRVRPAIVTGLIVVVLAIVSHLWLSGAWLRQAGFPDVPHAQPAATPTEPHVGFGRQPDETLVALGRSLQVARHP